MRKEIFILLLSIVVQLSVFGQNHLNTISAYKAVNLIGQEVIIKGKIVSYFYAKNSEGQPTFLNLEESYPNNPVAIIIFKRTLDRLNFNVKLYVNKTIIVQGKMEEYKEKTPPYGLKPNITITRIDQIKIID